VPDAALMLSVMPGFHPSDTTPLPRPTISDPTQAPAADLAALYHERWEVEGALAELKTHLRGARAVLRSKTPDLVRQEFWGLLLAHFAVRGLMHEAALRAGEDPDTLATLGASRLSSLQAVRVARSRARQVPRGVKRKMSGYPLRPRTPQPTTPRSRHHGGPMPPPRLPDVHIGTLRRVGAFYRFKQLPCTLSPTS